MNEIDLWAEAEDCEDKEIQYNLFELFGWSDYPTNEIDFDEIYNRIWEGESFDDIVKKKEKEDE